MMTKKGKKFIYAHGYVHTWEKEKRKKEREKEKNIFLYREKKLKQQKIIKRNTLVDNSLLQ